MLEPLFKLVSIFLVVRALHLSGLVGLKGSLFLDQVPYFSALLLFSLWLPKQLFSGEVGFLSSIKYENHLANGYNFAWAAIILILFDLSTTGLAQTSINQDTYSFVILIITILASLILWRACKSIKEIESLLAQKQLDDEKFRINFSRRLPNFIYRLLLFSMFLAPLLVAVGYVSGRIN